MREVVHQPVHVEAQDPRPFKGERIRGRAQSDDNLSPRYAYDKGAGQREAKLVSGAFTAKARTGTHAVLTRVLDQGSGPFRTRIGLLL